MRKSGRPPVQRRVAIGACAVLLVSLALPAVGASKWDQVEFHGKGWGHGVGMSQWGAYGMAVKGRSYQQILQHYYVGTSISALPTGASLWVNLEADVSNLTLDVLAAGAAPGAPVSLTSPAGDQVAPTGSSIDISALSDSGCKVAVTQAGAEVSSVSSTPCVVDLGWYEWAQGGAMPSTKVQIGGCSLTDWNATPSVSRPCQYAYGSLRLRSGAGGLDLSLELLMDDYVLGISEMPYHWPIEALKAQAVASRSYAEARKVASSNPATNSCGAYCHVRDTTADQRYVGWGHTQSAAWASAVTSTARQVLVHPSSPTGVIAAFYSSSSGGRTEFGHARGFSVNPVEWLSSVDDSLAVDGTVPNPNRAWVATVKSSTVASALGLDYLTSVRVTKTRPGSGSASEIEFRGQRNGQFVSLSRSGTWVRSTFGLKSEYLKVDFHLPGDEMLFYRPDGTFRYYDVNPDGGLGAPILSGTGYSKGWDSITAVDLDGDGQDELFFYRKDGTFRYYHVNPDGTIGAPVASGSGYSKGWSAITAVDLDGDGQDEMFFYRGDGTFRYYDVRPNGALGGPIASGSGYSKGWSAITAVDLDGDGQDEMFFYRGDGTFRYYDVQPNANLRSILSGSGYSKGWSAITAVDLDGDGQDEMFFYRGDGAYRYYDVRPSGSLGSTIRSGSEYSSSWGAVTGVDIDGE